MRTDDEALPIDAQQITIHYKGTRGRVGPLNWAQMDQWTAIQQSRSDCYVYNHVRAISLPADPVPSLARTLNAIAELYGRHESLRTIFLHDRNGIINQKFDREGSVSVEVSTTTERGLAATTYRLAGEYETMPFEYDREFPFRVGIVLTGDRVARIIFAVSHLAIDRGGMAVLEEDVVARLVDGHYAKPSGRCTPTMQPLDLAEHQRSERELHRARRKLDQVENLLRKAPRMRLPAMRPAHEENRYQGGRLRSEALNTALAILASRLRVSSSAAALGALVQEIHSLTGATDILIGLISSQRFDARIRHMVGTLVEETPLYVENVSADEDLSRIIRQVWIQSLKSYKNAGFDPVTYNEIVARVERERNGLDPTFAPVDNPRRRPLHYYFNDRHVAQTYDAELVHPFVECEENPSGFEFERIEDLDDQWFEFSVSLDGGPGTVELSLIIDTAFFPSNVIEPTLHRIADRLMRLAGAPAKTGEPQSGES